MGARWNGVFIVLRTSYTCRFDHFGPTDGWTDHHTAELHWNNCHTAVLYWIIYPCHSRETVAASTVKRLHLQRLVSSSSRKSSGVIDHHLWFLMTRSSFPLPILGKTNSTPQLKAFCHYPTSNSFRILCQCRSTIEPRWSKAETAVEAYLWDTIFS